MPRFRLALLLSIIATAPAAAQIQINPAGPAAPRVQNWVEVGASGDGVRMSYDTESVVRDGAYRIVRVRSAGPGDTVEDWLRFDCTNDRAQMIESFDSANRVRNETPWADVEPDMVLSLVLEDVCAR